MEIQKYIPEIRSVVFWDVPNGTPDYLKHRDFIICRVFNHGNFQEVADIILCYGKEYVKELLLTTADLDALGLEVAAAIFEIPETQFKCCELKRVYDTSVVSSVPSVGCISVPSVVNGCKNTETTEVTK